ncbi:MAG TPA: hypothetical protein VI653_16895 [Steroidobacteraceae bacterium]
MASRKRDLFYQVLSEAIDDLMTFGFDSQERLNRWVQKLDSAARATLVPISVLDRSVRDMLLRVYQRTVEGDRLLQRHEGISEFTLASIKPKLRGELDRRILASAELIKLNRETSIQRTLQRFAGWATSVPMGGTDVAERAEVKQNVRRGIAGLPFEERRVVIDQGHKLVSAINDIVARDGGAIAAIWHHVMEGGGYQARPEHVGRNGHVFVIRDNWALQKGLMKLAGHQYTDQVAEPGEEIYCRCWYEYIYNLRDLPPEMITSKGREALEIARQRLAG